MKCLPLVLLVSLHLFLLPSSFLLPSALRIQTLDTVSKASLLGSMEIFVGQQADYLLLSYRSDIESFTTKSIIITTNSQIHPHRRPQYKGKANKEK